MAKQAISITGFARQRAASRLKEVWSLPSTQHWEDTSGVLCPVFGSPEQERPGHVAESLAKGLDDNRGVGAPDAQGKDETPDIV